jgi:hypothetical protein
MVIPVLRRSGVTHDFASTTYDTTGTRALTYDAHASRTHSLAGDRPAGGAEGVAGVR